MRTKGVVTTFEEYDAIVRDMSGVTIFRGVNKDSHELVPSVGRLTPFKGKTFEYMERRLFDLFRESSYPYLDRTPTSPLEWLALGQHHRLPTRLLDWTYNPLVALFFAVERAGTHDALVYAMTGGKTMQPDDIPHYDPFTGKTLLRYRPTHVARRIPAQSGLFTIHPEPTVPLQADNVVKIVISGSARRHLKKVLYKYGVSWSALFPDLEGVSRDLKWHEADGH